MTPFVPIPSLLISTLAALAVYSPVKSAMKEGIGIGHRVSVWTHCFGHHYSISKPAIFALLLSSSPSDVPWKVSSIIIDSMNRMVRRWRIAYLFVKGFEAFKFWAYPNASVAIAAAHVRSSGFNSFSHAAPSFVDFSATLAVLGSPVLRGHGGSVP